MSDLIIVNEGWKENNTYCIQFRFNSNGRDSYFFAGASLNYFEKTFNVSGRDSVTTEIKDKWKEKIYRDFIPHGDHLLPYGSNDSDEKNVLDFLRSKFTG